MLGAVPVNTQPINKNCVIKTYHIVVSNYLANRNIQYFTFMYNQVTPCGQVTSVYAPQFSEKDSFIKTTNLYSSSSRDKRTQSNSMADHTDHT